MKLLKHLITTTKEMSMAEHHQQHLHSKLYSCLTEFAGIEYDDQQWMGDVTDDMILHMKELVNDKAKLENCVETLAKLEHRRWNSYMLSIGWKSASIEQVDKWYDTLNGHRNFSAKMHPCIISWEDLDGLSKWLLEKHNKKVDFKELDKIMVRELPNILTWAYEIYYERNMYLK